MPGRVQLPGSRLSVKRRTQAGEVLRGLQNHPGLIFLIGFRLNKDSHTFVCNVIIAFRLVNSIICTQVFNM